MQPLSPALFEGLSRTFTPLPPLHATPSAVGGFFFAVVTRSQPSPSVPFHTRPCESKRYGDVLLASYACTHRITAWTCMPT
jgi:hypothetical protein